MSEIVPESPQYLYLEADGELCRRLLGYRCERLGLQLDPERERELLERARGIPGRVAAMLDWMEEGGGDPDAVASMPPTLYGAMEALWDALAEPLRHTVALLCIAREPLPLVRVARLGPGSPVVDNDVMSEPGWQLLRDNILVRATLEDGTQALSPAHRTVGDFVLRRMAAGELPEPWEFHALLLGPLRTDEPYLLRHGLYHAAELAARPEPVAAPTLELLESAHQEDPGAALERLALDADFLGRQCLQLGVDAQARQLSEALERVAGLPAREPLATVAGAIAAGRERLRRHPDELPVLLSHRLALFAPALFERMGLAKRRTRLRPVGRIPEEAPSQPLLPRSAEAEDRFLFCLPLPARSEVAVASELGTLVHLGLNARRDESRPGGDGALFSVATTDPDGDALWLGTDRGRLIRIHYGVGTTLTAEEGFGAPVTALAAMSGGRLFSGFGDGSVSCLDSLHARPVWNLAGHQGAVNALLPLDAQRLVSAGEDGTLRVWDVTTGTVETRLTGHRGAVFRLVAVGRGHFASAGEDGLLRVWDRAGRLLAVLSGHRAPVRHCIALDAQGTVILSGDDQGTLILWDPEQGVTVRQWAGQGQPLAGLVALGDGGFAAWHEFGPVRIYTRGSHDLFRQVDSPGDPVADVAPAGVGEGYLLTRGGELVRFAVRSHDERPRETRDLLLHPDGMRILQAGFGTAEPGFGPSLVWRARVTGESLAQVVGLKAPVLALARNPTGDFLAALDHRGALYAWDADRSTPVLRVDVHRVLAQATALAVAWEGAVCAIGRANGEIHLWDLGGKLPDRVFHTRGAVSLCAFGLRDRLLAVGHADGGIELLALPDGQPLRRIGTGHGRLSGFVLSPADDRLASAGDDGLLRLWDADTGKLLQTFEGHRGRVTGCCFLADARLLASASEDGTLKLWDTGSGACLETFVGDAACTRLRQAAGTVLAVQDVAGRVWTLELVRPSG